MNLGIQSYHSYISRKLSDITSYTKSDNTEHSKYEKSVTFSKNNDVVEIPSRNELKHLRLWYSTYEIDIMKRQARLRNIQLHAALDSLKLHKNEPPESDETVEDSYEVIDENEDAVNGKIFFHHVFPTVKNFTKLMNSPMLSISNLKCGDKYLPKIYHSSSLQSLAYVPDENSRSIHTKRYINKFPSLPAINGEN